MTRQDTVAFILEQGRGAGHLTARRMFGEYGLYCDGKLVGLVCDDQLFMKPTAAGRSWLVTVTEAAPYLGARPHMLISGEHWEDAEWLSGLIRISAAALPVREVKQLKPRVGEPGA